jgi:DNA-binding NarL/FixJ family response regulator
LVHAAVERTPTPLDTGAPATRALSPREREVALLVARGRTNPEIAEILGTRLPTVRHQVEAVLRKVGADNRAAVAALVQHELLAESVPLPPGIDSEMLRVVWQDMQRSLA